MTPLHAFPDIARLLVLNTDSYKTSHWLQYPPGTTTVFSYIEARGGSLPYTVFFGLQALLKEYFTRPVTADDVALAAEVCAAHGVPFNRDGWGHIVAAHGGRLPLRIRAVPEGTVVPVNHALVTVENTDPACYWLTSYVETALLRIWYPTTVATHSHATRRLIADALARTGSPDGLPFIASGATVVIRPDSGDPTAIVLRTVASLADAFGSDTNAKGYRVLRHVRVIQGDGITRESIASILGALEAAGYSADNVAFGQGGALLQQVHRDTLGFAMKASAAEVDGRWRDVFKAPVTDLTKRSKAGRLTLLRQGHAFATVRLGSPGHQQALADGATDMLRTVFEDGRLLVDDSFAAIRARAADTADW